MNAQSQELLIRRSRRGSETSCQSLLPWQITSVSLRSLGREKTVQGGGTCTRRVKARSDSLQVPAVHMLFGSCGA